jgi:TonB family protein
LAERARLPTAAPAAPTDSVRECVRRCLGGETMPVLTYFPHIDPGEAPAVEPPSGQNPSGAGLGQIGMHGEVVFLFVVTRQGFVDQATLRVVSSTARNWEPLLLRALLDARFRPALDAGGPVRARVQLRFEMRTEGLGTVGSRTVTYRIFGPGER